MRKLVTLRTVSKLTPIEGADVIEVATVDGWECVVKKGEFVEGDWGIYFEIDSMIPHRDWCDHLFKNQKDIDRGFLRIKSIRLRGQLSQGLMLPLPLLLDTDLTDAIGVYKYEPPVPEDMSAKSRFPSFISKTDEERIQNLINYLPEYSKKLVYRTEKLEGSSITIHCVKNEEESTEKDVVWEYGVSSRNLELKLEIEMKDLESLVDDFKIIKVPSENKFVTTARNMKLEAKMKVWCDIHDKDLVLQGELIGTSIQDNIYNLKEKTIRFFTAQDGKNKRLNYDEFIEIINELELVTVPVLDVNVSLSDDFDYLLKDADGTSELYDTPREGVVYRAMDGSFSFKVVSNKYLLKSGR
jgi:RNA ligase (TIGR02306 family)